MARRRRDVDLFDQFDSGPKPRLTTASVRMTKDEKLALRVAALGCGLPVYRYLHELVMPTVYRDADMVMTKLSGNIEAAQSA
jgi:hypothetical protein